MDKYRDLLVIDDDLSPDVAGNPSLISDRDVIAQDLVHMIREKGFLPPLVGNRNRDLVERTKVAITLAVDNDHRIVPGSALIEEPEQGRFYLTADTMDFDSIGFFLEV
ncbi:MAG: DUF2590 family protein [Desulfobacteraceae bacterium]|nr:DUF2590 family protein [Desulfobacteraceae bacterium]